MGHTSGYFKATRTDKTSEFAGALKVNGALYAAGTQIPSITPTNTCYVNGSTGADTNDGTSWAKAFATAQKGVTVAGAYGIVYIAPKAMAAGATDPTDYAETIIIPATHECLSIVGIGNRTQGGLPQIKKGSGSTALLTIRAPGCTIANLGFNGSGSTGGGILLDDDGSTKTAFGTSILGCHFKNCKGSVATNAATGGAIQWASTGGAWQVRIAGNMFYKNVGDVVLLGTSAAVPQDVVIEDNIFSGPAASVDCNLYLAGGSGMNGVYVRNNVFPEFPNVGSGSNLLYASMTGCVGILAGNNFGNDKTFGAAGNGALIPTTVFLSGNWDEGGLIARV
jgi:hypothetical protein